MMNNLKLQLFLLVIFPSFCFHHVASSNEIPGDSGSANVSLITNKTCSSIVENGSLAVEIQEFENKVLRNVRDNFQTGIIELLEIISSLNKSLAAQKEEISALKEENKLIRKLNNLKSHLSWEEFDELIRGKNTEIGSSFNGSTLSDITSRASSLNLRGSYCAVVVVNHLDEKITDFKIFLRIGKIFNPALNSIPAFSEEIFTIAEPIGYTAWMSFSYVIPSKNIRIGAIAIGGSIDAGLAFLPTDANMFDYYNSRFGIPGSSVYENGDEREDRNLTVGYKNLFARMFVGDEGYRKTTLRLELVELPLDG